MSELLTPLKGKRRRRDFLVLDIESKDGESQDAGFTRPFMVGVYDGKFYTPCFDQNRDAGHRWEERYFLEGGCVDVAMRAILRRRYRGWHIYAHNAGRFDYLFLLPWLMRVGRRAGFRFSLVPVSSSIQVLDVWHENDDGNRMARWRFLDSYRLIPTTLDKAAKSFGLEGKKKHDLNLHENDPSWTVYNGQDCTELYNVLSKFHHYIEDKLGGEVGITAPSTSIKLFRRKYLHKPVPRNVETHSFVREGYVGGRVEAYLKRAERLRYFDINSSYPRAMLEDMPGGKAVLWEGKPPTRFLNERLGFVEANVEVPESLHIPPLPIRFTSGSLSCEATRVKGETLPVGKLVFPVGRLRGVWEWDELQMALEYGCRIVDWGRSAWFERTQMFGDFINELYKYRDKSSPDYEAGLADVCKYMMNSGYGKFGMRTRRKKLYQFDDPNIPEHALPLRGDPDCPIWYAEEEVDAAYIMPQISARVTSLGRIRLYRAMMAAHKLGGFVAYCDTDSVLTDVVLPTGTSLGELKDEYPEVSGKLVGEFLGPKLYLLSAPESEWRDYQGKPFDKVKAKGLEKRTRENVEKLARGEIIKQRRLEKVGALARDGFNRGPRMITVPRRILPDAGKRVMLPDGTTKPYTVRMW